MFPSPGPSPSPSPGPAFLYLNQHHQQQQHHHGAGGGSSGGGGAGSAATGAGGAGAGTNGSAMAFGGPSAPPPPPMNGGAPGFPLPRFPQGSGSSAAAAAAMGAWGSRAQQPSQTHSHHQQNPSLSSMPGSLGSAGVNGGLNSPAGFGGLGSHHHPHGAPPQQQQQQRDHHSQHPHHHAHSALSSGHLAHMPSPGALHSSGAAAAAVANHLSSSSSSSSSASIAAAAGISQHWQQQLIKAEISRQSASPHHHARAAALAARSATSAAVAITDPNKGTMHIPQTAANGLHLSSKKEGQSDEAADGIDGVGAKGKDAANGEAQQSWTTIDMGGLGLRSLAREVYRYDFLTSLFINHNSLTSLSPDIIRLQKLTILDASGNKLVSLPSEMGMLTSLKELYLFDNQLVMLPPELGMLYNLELLGIEGNPMADNIRSLAQREGTQAVVSFLRDSCPVPLPPPEREWISIEPDLPAPRSEADGGEPPVETFNVLCYNVLCEKYATQAMYGYTPSWALAWEYRKEFILQEVMSYAADICCLQEVDQEQYEEYFSHHLSQQDYEGVYWPKSRARTMRDEERRRVDGCATFYKATKFSLIEKQLIEFNQIALQRPDFKKTEDMFNRVMTKDNIAVIALLENKESGSRLIVANVHVHWDPEFRDVKLVQTAMLMDELEKIADRFAKYPAKLNVAEGFPPAPKYTSGAQIPTMICGDFNSVPDSGVYDFLSSGALAGNHEDFMDHIYGRYTAEGMGHRLPLKSAYANVGELPFTNYTPNFEGVIDYVWYNQNALAVTGLLGEVEKAYLSKVVGFPNAHFPSDHICILSEFRVKHPRKEGDGPVPRKVDFGNHSGGGGRHR